jgi:pimeloyl-ACP methyl ester carboxylesterase
MGSKLRDKRTKRLVWVDFKSIPLNPLQWDDWLTNLLQALAYPNDDLEASSIMDEIIFVPPWAKQEHYGRLLVALEQMGYRADASRYTERELNVYTFPYDWRQDNRRSAQQLGEAIERWRTYHPGVQAWILAHSNGGLVARWYIEKLGGKERVGRLFLFGSPWDGAPKIMMMLFNGLDTLFRRRFTAFGIPRRSRDMIRTFPSAYQLIPAHNPFLCDENNQTLDPFQSKNWLEDNMRNLALDGRRFNTDLGMTLSVDTLCFFGRTRPTTTAGRVSLAAQSRWNTIEWLSTASGDGTIPERSAVHTNASGKYPFVASHGDIYVNPAVLEFLRWELVDKYSLTSKELVATPSLVINFEPDKDMVSPGESIGVWATVHSKDDETPITDAQIDVRLSWRDALPGDVAQATLHQFTPAITLQSDPDTPGRYIGSLPAPQAEGYYSLTATVRAADETVPVNEIIAVEAAL